MACPHSRLNYSNPSNCSQCLGVTPRKVVVQDGLITIDGQEHKNLADSNKALYFEETQHSIPRKHRTCGICRLPGHNSRSCKSSAPVTVITLFN